MKIFIMRIKMFFNLQSTKIFLKVFAISFPIVCTLTYFLVLQFIDIMDKKDMQDMFSDFSEIVDTRPIPDNDVIIDYSKPEQRKVINNSNPYFWKGDALKYRYTIPGQGIPNSNKE